MNLSRPKGSSTSLVLKRKNPLNVEGHRPASVKETRWASRDELPPRGHRRLLARAACVPTPWLAHHSDLTLQGTLRNCQLAYPQDNI